jgi:hypothetical protein
MLAKMGVRYAGYERELQPYSIGFLSVVQTVKFSRIIKFSFKVELIRSQTRKV